MNTHVDIDRDAFEQVGRPAGRVLGALEREWDGKPIATRGTYRGISLADYHGNRDLFDGPSVSKSALKWLLPAHGGSPKAFWGRWRWNPHHVAEKTSDALDFGKAVHCLLLGDEDFNDSFVVRPVHRPDDMGLPEKERRHWNANANDCKAFLTDAADRGLTIISPDQIDRIKRIRDDAAQHHLIKLGVLNGRIERTLCVKDRETGIWLKVRPDAMPHADGVFADLKTASKFDEDFLERQIFDAGYYLQAAMIRMVCRELGIPFETFVLIYVLNDDVPDTAHVELSVHEIDRGERAIRWCLQTIRKGLDAGDWPGARPFDGGERAAQMKPWAKESIDRFLEREAA